MPTPKKGARLGSNPKHQKAMLSNLALSLFDHERIKTTEAKAKMLRPYAEKLITKAKKGDVHNRRQVLSVIEDREIVHKLFADIAPRFADRNGGYTRILKLGPRSGDNAPMVLMELVEGAKSETATEESTEETSRRRRLSRPARRKGASTDPSLPQDKPVRSKAAEAAAAGTPAGDADVESPDGAESAAAEGDLAAEETSAEASSGAAEENLSDAPANTSADGGQADTGDAGESGKR